MTEKMKNDLLLPVKFLAIIWIVFIIDIVIPIDFAKFGIRPRTISGLIGIPLSPFIHGGLSHIIGNSFPLFILLSVTIAFFRKQIYLIITSIIIIGGGLVWILGRDSYHVGASGLIYGLVGFLIAFGIFKKKIVPIIVSIIIGITYGTSMIYGVLPIAKGVSWEGHLFGAVAGVITAKFLANKFKG